MIPVTRSYSAGITISHDAAIDLQTHTHLSDGEWTPEALLDHFVSQGFSTAAITDHDRVDTLERLQEMAQERDFPLLVAAEMTTTWRDGIVDILCFGFEQNPEPLHKLCLALYEEQSATSRKVYSYLVQNGHIPDNNSAELDAIVNASTSKQPHLLVDLFIKHNPNTEDFTPLKEAGYKLCTNPTNAVVNAVHRGGGVALIAHPGRTDGFVTFDAELLDQFRAEIPVDGLEVYYPRHTDEQIALYQQYAQKHDLLVSAGSDSHTPENPPIKYRASQCAKLLERLEFTLS